jgi:hypothetical protein
MYIWFEPSRLNVIIV